MGDGEMKPTPKGIKLLPPDWEELCKNFGAIDAAFGEKETTISFGSKKDIVVSVASDTIDIRAYYTDKTDGQLKPTKKGCRLDREGWNKLKTVAQQLSEKLGAAPAESSEPQKKK